MNRINILFLGGAKRVSLAEHFIAAGERLNCKIGIFSYELDEKCPIASVGTVIKGKKWRDADLMKDLAHVIQENSINIVLPSVDPAIGVASRLRSFVDKKVFIPISDVSICDTMFDKKLSEKWFIDNQIPIPESYSCDDELIYPVFIKPRNGSASKGLEIIRNKEEWVKVSNHDNYVIQRYIQNKKEFTVDCYVAQSGEIISVVPRERLAVAGGEVMSSKTLHDEPIEQAARYVLSKGTFRGPVNIQFIKDMDNGKAYVMEINPRFGGGVITSIEAGADTPSYVLKEFLGQELTVCQDWKPETLMTRYFKEVIFYADNN